MSNQLSRILGVLIASLLTACSQNIPVGDNFLPKTLRGHLGKPEVVLNRLAGKWTVLKRSDGKYIDLTAETGLRVDESCVVV